MPRIKLVEAATDKPISELTYANAEDYKGVVLTHRSTGTTAKIIGKFVSFGGTEWIALNNGHFMEPLTVRKAFRTDGDLDGFEPKEYRDGIIKAYIAQAKKLRFAVPKKDSYGKPNPDGGDLIVVDPEGHEYVFRIDCRGYSSISVHAHTDAPTSSGKGYRSQSVNFTKNRLLKMGTPEEAGKAVAEQNPLPDFPAEF